MLSNPSNTFLGIASRISASDKDLPVLNQLKNDGYL